MKFVGLDFAFALELFGYLAIGFVLLYLLKLRRRRVTVPFSPLWARVLADKDASNWLQRLKRLLSLLLMLFIIAVILFALLDPQPVEKIERGRTYAVVIDTSASMSASEENRTRFQTAFEQVSQLIDEMGPHDTMMIIAMDGQVRSITGDFTGKKATLKEALRDLKPTATEAQVKEALRTAADSLRDRLDPKLVLFSDGAFGPNFTFPKEVVGEDIEFEHVLIGESEGNIAITGFNIRRYLTNKLDYEVFIQVESYFDRDVDAVLSIYNLVEDPSLPGRFDRKIIDKISIQLGPGDTHLELIPNLARGSDHLAASIEITSPDVKDNLEMDNTAYVLVPAFEKANILLISPGNLFLLAAFVLNHDYEVFEVLPQDIRAELPDAFEGASTRAILKTAVDLANARSKAQDPDSPTMALEDFDAIVFDNSLWAEGMYPVTPDLEGIPGNFLFVNPRGDNSPFPVSGTITEPLVERVYRNHPLSRWLVMKDLNITEAARIRTQSGDKVAVKAISGPLVVSRRKGGTNIVAMAFSILESDIVFRVALPVLLLNTVDWFQNESNSLIQAYYAGESWHIPVPDGVSAVDIRYPDGKLDRDVPTHEGNVVLYGALTGFYKLTPARNAGARPEQPSPLAGESWEIASNFDTSRESLITPMAEALDRIEPPPSVVNERKQKQEEQLEGWSWVFAKFDRDLWLYCVFLVLGLLLFEWLTFHRRITV